MIIINQNRTEVFNFNGIYRLFIDEWFWDNSSKEPDCFYIRAEKNNGDVFCNILGEYKTEEKAKTNMLSKSRFSIAITMKCTECQKSKRDFMWKNLK